MMIEQLADDFRDRYAEQLEVAARALASGRWTEADGPAVLGTLAALQGDLEQAAVIYALDRTIRCPHCGAEMAIVDLARR
jgi:hypothetical protein